MPRVKMPAVTTKVIRVLRQNARVVNWLPSEVQALSPLTCQVLNFKAEKSNHPVRQERIAIAITAKPSHTASQSSLNQFSLCFKVLFVLCGRNNQPAD